MKPLNQLTDQEKQIIKQYITLNLIRIALEHDKWVFKNEKIKFKDCYLEFVNRALEWLREDEKKNREELFSHFIRIKKYSWSHYEIFTRGVLFKIKLTNSQAKDLVDQNINKYLITD